MDISSKMPLLLRNICTAPLGIHVQFSVTYAFMLRIFDHLGCLITQVVLELPSDSRKMMLCQIVQAFKV